MRIQSIRSDEELNQRLLKSKKADETVCEYLKRIVPTVGEIDEMESLRQSLESKAFQTAHDEGAELWRSEGARVKKRLQSEG